MPEKSIPRPMNAFMLFRSAFVRNSPQIKKDKKIFTQASKSKLASATWNAMSREEQEPWFQAATEAKEEHQRNYPGYKYSPKKRTINMTEQASETNSISPRSVARSSSRAALRGAGAPSTLVSDPADTRTVANPNSYPRTEVSSASDAYHGFLLQPHSSQVSSVQAPHPHHASSPRALLAIRDSGNAASFELPAASSSRPSIYASGSNLTIPAPWCGLPNEATSWEYGKTSGDDLWATESFHNGVSNYAPSPYDWSVDSELYRMEDCFTVLTDRSGEY